MSPIPVPFESLTTLSRVVDEHLGDHGVGTRSSVFHLCIEAVSFAREADEALVGIRARSAAELLIELTCPDLLPAVVRELGLACERVATGSV